MLFLSIYVNLSYWHRCIFLYWFLVLVLNGGTPGGGYEGQGGLLFFVGAFGRQLSQISHRKLKISISHSPKMYDWEKIFVLNNIPTLLLPQIEKNVEIKLGKTKLKCLLQTSCGRLIYEVVFPRDECSVSRRTQLPLAEIFPLDQPYRLIFSRSGRSKLGPA